MLDESFSEIVKKANDENKHISSTFTIQLEPSKDTPTGMANYEVQYARDVIFTIVNAFMKGNNIDASIINEQVLTYKEGE